MTSCCIKSVDMSVGDITSESITIARPSMCLLEIDCIIHVYANNT